jgi:5-methyltetrahydropteroyltriglutamate--homocysteine methyltransferase
MVLACNLGFPRIGGKRQLKKALEEFWSGKCDAEDLTAVGRQLRHANWALQADLGLDHIPVNDFSFYDQVLDMSLVVGAVDQRFQQDNKATSLDNYFRMARGAADVRPLKMTKWFNTNYHYLVPELAAHQKFELLSTKPVDEFLEAKEQGFAARPVIIGPISFLILCSGGDASERLKHLDGLLEVYIQLLTTLRASGATWVQIDEPFLATDLPENVRHAFANAYDRLATARGSSLQLLLTTYFGGLRDNLNLAMVLPVDGLHVDLVTAPDELANVLRSLPPHMHLSAGVIDGRNVFKPRLGPIIETLEDIAEKIGPERLQIAPSCSLLHVPLDIDLERALEPQTSSWLSFAKQKLQEISLLAEAIVCGKRDIEHLLNENEALWKERSMSSRTRNESLRKRLQAVSADMYKRKSPHGQRKRIQAEALQLPSLPTTTIGSFPQTAEIRKARNDLRAKKLAEAEYEQLMRSEIDNAIAVQERLDIDVLVHGEPERTDMVEYFAEQLEGVLTTQHGWVQSYGSRCIRPPVIYGDVTRPHPMTVKWITYAQKQTGRPVKGMLTGPVTMQQWAFVRDDEPRELICKQLALAILDEVQDLERAGIRVIQIDEPAFREGAPLRLADRADYFRWAVESFQLSSAGVSDSTQIHTHMCYSDFEAIIEEIARMDADVITIEASRSRMGLLDVFGEFNYPNDIGPGFFDVHSPVIPTEDDITALIRQALRVLPADKLWVNPDCGLKTRHWQEVMPALEAMVRAAARVRSETSSQNATQPGKVSSRRQN